MLSNLIFDDIPPKMKFCRNSKAILQSCLKLEPCKPHKIARHLTKCDVIHDVKLFPDILSRIFDSIQSSTLE